MQVLSSPAEKEANDCGSATWQVSDLAQVVPLGPWLRHVPAQGGRTLPGGSRPPGPYTWRLLTVGAVRRSSLVPVEGGGWRVASNQGCIRVLRVPGHEHAASLIVSMAGTVILWLPATTL
jgi:hypothetical protein